ncbi:MAG TPA: universal stress protein [Gemmatimonadaceae bacterium]|nr:universal stress protein [Gemmatimonadaceae bacterium]
MFNRLLVPLDGSELAEEAIGRAVAIARASNAKVEFLMAHQPFLVVGEDPGLAAKRMAQEDAYLRGIADEVFSGAGIAATHSVVPGDPVDVICRRARDCAIDLIVMTSHGRGGWSRAWIGSVADGVARHSTAPVLMLRATHAAQDRRRARQVFHRILAPLDGLTAAMEIAGPLASLARCSSASVSLLQVVEPVRLVGMEMALPLTYAAAMIDNESTEALVKGAGRDLATAAEILKRQGIGTVDRTVVVSTAVASAIADFARSNAVDAIAMTTHGRGLSRLLIGSVADKVRRAVDVPVLLEPASVRLGRHALTEDSIVEQLPALAGVRG